MNTKSKDVQEDIELLLPWHAAGTLSRKDAARVEHALANDNELARRYEMVRDELGEAIHLNESLGAPSARAMTSLFAKIDAEPARSPKASFNLGAWMGSFVAGFSPRTLAYSGIAAALAIVLQAGMIAGVVLKDRGAPAQMAESGSGTGPVLSSLPEEAFEPGSFVLIRFKPDANSADITKFLQDNKSIVVNGPMAGSGLYRLRVAEMALSTAELGAVVKRMQANPVVGFTVPAATP